MPPEKRRIAERDRVNAKVARTNHAISSFFQLTPKKSSVNENDPDIDTHRPSTPTPVTPSAEHTPTKRQITCPMSTPTSAKKIAEPQTPTSQKRKTAGHKVGFNADWQDGRPWLLHKIEVVNDDEDTASVMYCKLCQQYSSTGLNGSRSWVDAGCKTLRLDKVKDHENSAQHKQSLSQSLNESLNTMTDKVNTAAQEAILNALRVLQFIIQNNLALDLFGSLTDLCIAVGSESLSNLRLAKNASYTSWDIVNELLELLSNEVRGEVKNNIQASPCYSTMVDEVCDLTIEKHLAICCKYVSSSGDQKTAFLSDTTLPSATADVVTAAITREVENHGLIMDNMTGFASDGAAVFVGKKSGVSTRLKEEIPALVTIHCKDHRLALACRDSFLKVPQFKKTDKMLEDTYRYYKNSSKKTASLKNVQTSFQEAPLGIKQAKHHRWLSHDKAVNSIIRSYRSLLVDLESSTVSEDPIGNGLRKSYKNPLNLYILLLLADVLPHLACLSLFFQKTDLHLGMVQATVDKTLRMLEKRKTENGAWLQKAETIMADCEMECDSKSACEFNTIRAEFLTGLVNNISSRFADCDIVEALSVLDLSDLVEVPAFHGQSEMDILADRYEMDHEDLHTQWHGFTELMYTTPSSNRGLDQLAKLFHGKEHSNKGLRAQFPLVGRLVAAAITLPLSTAEVERVFSQLKLIKTDHRCSLKARTVDMLLNVKLNGSSELFEQLRPVVVKKFFMKDRRICSVIAGNM